MENYFSSLQVSNLDARNSKKKEDFNKIKDRKKNSYDSLVL